MSAEINDLKRSPFRSVNGVYSGPQQLALAGGVKRALMSPDAVVTLRGPAGAGKTTSIRHALARSGSSAMIARIGRVHLGREDVLDVLLDEFKVQHKPSNALQRFSALKQLLRSWAETGTSAVVVVEDVERLGVDGLVELESLTATDGDDTPGANLILMGTVDLRNFLLQPELARLRQRVRRNLELEPFALGETRGYIEHCLSATYTSLEQVFEGGAIEVIHACSGGIARLINNIAESMMVIAADTNNGRVTEALSREIASEEFDFSRETAVNDSSASPASTSAVEPMTPPAAVVEADPKAEAASKVPSATEDRLPELIQDMQPPVPVLTDIEAGPAQTGTVATDPEYAKKVAAWLESADATEPSLPVLTITDQEAEDRTNRIRVEPRAPERLSKAERSDTQTIQALDDALRPDTQLLRTLDAPPPPPADDDAPVPLGLRDAVERKTVNDPRGTPPSQESLGDASKAASKPAAAPPAQPEETDSAGAESPAATAGESPVPDASHAQASAPTTSAPETSTTTTAANEDETAKAPAVGSTKPSEIQEITLDRSLDDRQKEIRTKREEEARQEQAAAEEKARREAEEEFEANKEARKEAERKQILESLSARFSEAKSLEDVMDDTAAETLFGEEFSQTAAAVASMGAPMPGDDVDDGEKATRVTVEDQKVSETAEAGSDEKTEAPVELQLDVEPAAARGSENSGNQQEQERNIETAAAPVAAPPTAPVPPVPGASQTSGDPAGKPAATARPIPAAKAVPVTPAAGGGGLGTSATQRLRMVQALNKKADKAPSAPAVPKKLGEEIVLGDSINTALVSGRKPAPIENQFGEMTASLKALDSEANEAPPKGDDEPEGKKKGFLARFRRS